MKFSPDEIKFNDQGLVPVIVQDADNSEILMLAYMNRLALETTLQTKRATFFSRSRSEIWVKGKTSGNVQVVKDIYYDCDCDTLLVKVEQTGGACHEGYRTCFFRRIADENGQVEIVGEKMFDPKEIYKK